MLKLAGYGRKSTKIVARHGLPPRTEIALGNTAFEMSVRDVLGLCDEIGAVGDLEFLHPARTRSVARSCG